MRGPEVVATFPSTRAAMAAERALQAAGVAGRIVPLPVTISADCGLAWACGRADAGALVGACERLGLAVSAVWDLTGDAPALLGSVAVGDPRGTDDTKGGPQCSA